MIPRTGEENTFRAKSVFFSFAHSLYFFSFVASQNCAMGAGFSPLQHS